MKTILLKKGREKSLMRRHPWVFSGAVASAPEGVAAGETVRVAAAGGETLGYGSYSPASNIRVRMLAFGDGQIPDAGYVGRLVAAAVARRAKRSATRLVNAENDGLPGVVADWYAGWIVCQFTSAGAEYWKGTIADALMAAMPECRGVAERADADVRVREGLEAGDFAVLRGEEPPETVEIEENGLRFLVDVRKGHKTGFYLDQREARETVGALSQGREVLNCFCYTGGFGLAAAACGAKAVTQVDVSEQALELAKKNAELNDGALKTAVGRMAFVCADVFKYLRKCRDEGRQFDMIVLDPPKFAESRSQVMKAARGYKDINLLAMKLLRTDGILATFSCSGAIDEELFVKILAEAAADANADFQCIGRTGQPSDHPVALSFPEGRYLKGCILRKSGIAGPAQPA